MLLDHPGPSALPLDMGKGKRQGWVNRADRESGKGLQGRHLKQRATSDGKGLHIARAMLCDHCRAKRGYSILSLVMPCRFEDTSHGLETFFVINYSTEFMLRFLSCPNYIAFGCPPQPTLLNTRFAQTPKILSQLFYWSTNPCSAARSNFMNWVDFLSIAPFYFEVTH